MYLKYLDQCTCSAIIVCLEKNVINSEADTPDGYMKKLIKTIWEQGKEHNSTQP